MYQFTQDLENIQHRINQFLENQFLNIESSPSPLAEAMKYALLLGGKRIRPFLVYKTGEMLGAEIKQLDYAAAAVEAIHAYSLIHDDLPAMDNDTLRRGKATCHIAFDEATAILAGDALQPFAFQLLTQIPRLFSEQKLQLIDVLANASGIKGMCLGQSLDLTYEHKQIDLNTLEKIHQNKTGALLKASIHLGFICSPHFKDETIAQKLNDYADAIGLAFQVQDDILDIEGDTLTTGKNIGTDLLADKSTYPKLLGLAGAKEKAKLLHSHAINALDTLNFDSSALKALAEFIITRRS